MINVNELIKDCMFSVEMVNREDDVDSWWGISAYRITKEQVVKLLQGECIYFNDGEYANVIYLDDIELKED